MFGSNYRRAAHQMSIWYRLFSQMRTLQFVKNDRLHEFKPNPNVYTPLAYKSIWLRHDFPFSKWTYSTMNLQDKWQNMKTNHQICIVLCLQLISANTGPTTTWLQATGWPEEEVTAECRHNAHHVPVGLLLCEPQSERASPTVGHCSNTVGVYWTWRKAHQSATARFDLSLEA